MEKGREDLQQDARINYVFFGLYFLIISIIHVIHVFLIEPELSFSTYFFSIYALSQSFLETLSLLIGVLLVRRCAPRLLNCYVIFVFFMFLSHLIDFPLMRLMDMSFWYALHFVSQESYENFIELLLASNVSLFVWFLAGLGGIALLMSGLYLFRITERMAARRVCQISMPLLSAVLFTTSLFLVSWDHGVRRHVSQAFFDRYQKTLPWKSTIYPSRIEHVALNAPLKELQGEEELFQKLDSRIFSLVHKPDIYLFIVESLREDYIIPEIAPHLSQFKQEHISFPLALANANATHLSWFSLFYSQFPFYWGKASPDERKQGSLSLGLLKKMGYRIFVSSSARLGYYQMDQIIFGQGNHLAEEIFVPDDMETSEPYQRDTKAMEHLYSKMEKEESGRVFITFLDATHFDYSWPREMTQFYPFGEKINYFKIALSRDGVNDIKNRYRNSLFFVDSLFGKFFDVLKRAPGGEEAIVVITGDHGEEFYEHGNLFHASTLSQPQIHIPLYYRFGAKNLLNNRVKCGMTCHMDVFPSIFEYLTGEDLLSDVLQGESIFKEARWPYTVVGRFNASRSPAEFCIHKGESKVTARFSEEADIFKSKSIKIVSTKNCQDENIPKEISSLYEEFGTALDRIFPK